MDNREPGMIRRRPGGPLVSGWQVLVMAKTPVAGRVKTRLSPALTPDQAAEVAAAALADTLAAVVACGVARRVLALEGAPGDWIPPGFTVVAQRGGSLNERLAAAWSDAGGPGLQIGMDTPQVTPELLDRCLGMTAAPGIGASIGLAEDGGWWALGLGGGWQGDLFAGVEMSVATTGAAQRSALVAHGHVVAELPVLRDIDQVEDLVAVADQAPDSRVAATWRAMAPGVVMGSARLPGA